MRSGGAAQIVGRGPSCAVITSRCDFLPATRERQRPSVQSALSLRSSSTSPVSGRWKPSQRVISDISEGGAHVGMVLMCRNPFGENARGRKKGGEIRLALRGFPLREAQQIDDGPPYRPGLR